MNPIILQFKNPSRGTQLHVCSITTCIKLKQSYISALIIFFSFFFKFSNAQNVGISSVSSFIPDASAGLDVNYSSKGLLIPRVALTATNAAGPIASPATSLMVYNTATTGILPNNVTPGYYYWNGTAWVAITTSATSWLLTGNTGTTAGTNFIGTNDAVDFVTKTNGVERIRVSSLGDVAIGGTASNATNPEQLLVDAGTTTSSFNVITGKGSLNNYLQLNIQNGSNGTNASSDVVATANDGSESTYYIDMGINGSGNTMNNYGVAHDAYLFNTAGAGTGGNLYIGTSSANKSLGFLTGGTTVGTVVGTTMTPNNERLRIDGATGNVGIGTISPTDKLTVAGNVVPTVTATYNLGTSTLRWNNVYTNNLIQVSDRRMKTNIKTLNYGLKEVLALRPVSFNWKTKPHTEHKVGLIAQEVRKIVPEVVVGNETKETIGMNYAELVPVLINAIKQQQQEIDFLQKQVKKLNNRPNLR